MSRISKIFISTILPLVFAFPVAAQQDVPVRENASNQIREMRQNIMEEAKDAGQEVRTETKEAVQNIRQEFQLKWQQARQLIERQRSEFKQQIQSRREGVRSLMEQNRAEMEKRLENIKNEQKRRAVEKINENIGKLNERLTDHFSNVSEHLENILEKVSSRADKAEANGRDVAVIRAAIASALETIASARAAIMEQSGKTYEIAVSEEGALKADVGAARQTFHADMVAVRDVMFEARDAVKTAIQSLGRIPDVDALELPVESSAENESGEAAD